jgi:hypothetical protein
MPRTTTGGDRSGRCTCSRHLPTLLLRASTERGSSVAFARHPRTAWIRTTVVLTVLSLVPDVLADAAVTTKMLLMVTHLVAAAIVIPAVARRLRA